jgi:hypothetical protein
VNAENSDPGQPSIVSFEQSREMQHAIAEVLREYLDAQRLRRR